VQTFGDRAHVRLADGDPDAVIASIRERLRAHDIRLLSARPIGATLEDVFIGLVGAAPAAASPATREADA
jgi:hypothetical protein